MKNTSGSSDNLSLLTDFYELTMANGFLKNGPAGTVAYYDMFFRSTPDSGGFAVMAGISRLIEYLESLRFDSDDMEYLETL